MRPRTFASNCQWCSLTRPSSGWDAELSSDARLYANSWDATYRGRSSAWSICSTSTARARLRLCGGCPASWWRSSRMERDRKYAVTGVCIELLYEAFGNMNLGRIWRVAVIGLGITPLPALVYMYAVSPTCT